MAIEIVDLPMKTGDFRWFTLQFSPRLRQTMSPSFVGRAVLELSKRDAAKMASKDLMVLLQSLGMPGTDGGGKHVEDGLKL